VKSGDIVRVNPKRGTWLFASHKHDDISTVGMVGEDEILMLLEVIDNMYHVYSSKTGCSGWVFEEYLVKL